MVVVVNAEYLNEAGPLSSAPCVQLSNLAIRLLREIAYLLLLLEDRDAFSVAVC